MRKYRLWQFCTNEKHPVSCEETEQTYLLPDEPTTEDLRQAMAREGFETEKTYFMRVSATKWYLAYGRKWYATHIVSIEKE